MGLGGVADLEARQQPELHRLADQRIGAGDHRLARDHGCGGRQHHQRQQHDLRRHPVEGVLDHGRIGQIGQHQRTLAEIIDQQRRQHEEEPPGLDRFAAEMTEIGIKRLAAGDREKHRAQRHQSDGAVRQQELDAVPGIDRRQHRRIVADVNDAQHRNGCEPYHHDRPERGSDPRRATALHREQRDEDEHRQRHHVRFERGRGEFQAFDRRQHRDRRCDHGIADEHRGADHAERHQHPASAAERALAERHPRQRTALAIVVGAQQQQDIFGGDDGKQRPQDQREHAEHDGARRRLSVTRGAGNRFAKRVQRRGTDVAEYHADASEHQAPKARCRRSLMGLGGCDAHSHDAWKTPYLIF